MKKSPTKALVKSPVPAQLTGVHRALGDPLRLRVFELLAGDQMTVRELAEALGSPPDRLYYHLRILEEAGLIRLVELRPERVYEAAPFPSGDTGPVPPRAETAAFLAAVLEATRVELEAVVGGEGNKATGPVTVERAQLELSAARFREFNRRFGQLLEEFSAGPAGRGPSPYRVVLALYPTPGR